MRHKLVCKRLAISSLREGAVEGCMSARQSQVEHRKGLPGVPSSRPVSLSEKRSLYKAERETGLRKRMRAALHGEVFAQAFDPGSTLVAIVDDTQNGTTQAYPSFVIMSVRRYGRIMDI
jgi:hypothetical protein